MPGLTDTGSTLPAEIDFDADRDATPARMNRAMKWLYAQLRIAQASAKSYEVVIEELRALGLSRVAEALTPVFLQAQQIGDQLAAIRDQWTDADLILANHYTRAEADAAFAAIDHGHAVADVEGLEAILTATATTLGQKADAAALAAFLARAGGTMAGQLGLAAGLGLLFDLGTDPADKANGQLWGHVTQGMRYQFSNTTYNVVLDSRPQTLSQKTLANPLLEGSPVEDSDFLITDNASVTLDPVNGSTQTWVLGANRTPNLALITPGKFIRLAVDDGAGYAIDLSAATLRNNGGDEPALKPAGFTWFLIENVRGTLYRDLLGDGG
ncbi:hypothetical protein MB02_01170 [Croceicoccus estronivorus]|uniref:hypothetical protein n=1 Tax=Croceicoccus estronivorus TaxID=1172626 RepID=UPI00082B786E|nr:hypothetical protein [Croceicoccus estronivorus]OCC25313.1 hypothetical protein MB02_01170 [Croceicoccus estronivorus]